MLFDAAGLFVVLCFAVEPYRVGSIFVRALRIYIVLLCFGIGPGSPTH